MNATVTSINLATNTEIIEAMRSVAVGSDHWRLGEALAVQIPAGQGGFDEIIEEAKAAGVDTGLSATTLRLYRDAALRWPADKRVPNVSFTAHREALPLADVAARRKLLIDMAAEMGASKVSAGKVKARVKEIKAFQDGTATVSATRKTPEEVAAIAMLADVLAGSPMLIKAIGTGKDLDLDKLHAGLNKALAKVDGLRAKANLRAQTAAKRATTAAPKATTTPKTTPKPKTTPRTTPKASTTPKAGDLRSL